MNPSEARALPADARLAWLEIDLAAIRHNYRIFRRRAGASTVVFAVVKADAYGHGAVDTARALAAEGVDRLCVARMEEALELRAAGITAPLLVFAPPLTAACAALAGEGITLTACDPAHLDAIAAAAAATGRTLPVHIKVDVGMGRLGVRPEDALAFARAAAARPGITLDGVMTHFPCADGPPRSVTERQIADFLAVRAGLLDAGIRPNVFHCANSAAALDFPEAHLDAIRPGISLYGQYPSADVVARVPLRPAMAFRSRVTFVKDVPAGRGLSYGHTFVTRRPSRVATVPVGYADGYPRHASGRARALVRGTAVPQVGRVCMDQILLDVTDLPAVTPGDTVTLFGTDGDASYTAEDFAADAGTIGYEITTRIGKRLPRVLAD